MAALVSWWALSEPALTEIRESEWPGGLSHGCELETSVILHFRPDLVHMERAERDMSYPKSKYFFWDLQRPSRIHFQEFFSRNSRTGTKGDPTSATAEKGRRVVECVVENMVELVREFRERPIAPRDVKRAIDYMEAHLDAAITLGSIVEASGVAGRTLLKHFRDTKGVSPMRYLTNARFERVRDALSRDQRGESVTTIAMSWGFSHMGRFSVEYRRRFGESPSDTLRGRHPRVPTRLKM